MIAIILAFLVVASHVASQSSHVASATISVSPTASVWVPSSIQWTPCFEARQANYNLTFTCANLTVPLDYLNNPQNKTTQVGVAKAHPMELAEPLGELFMGQMLGWSNILSFNIEVNLFPVILNLTNRQYDIMLVDPRGVGWSSFFECIIQPENATAVYGPNPSPNSNVSLASIEQNVEYQTFPGACANIDADYLTHVNTPLLARDLDLVRNLTGVDSLNYLAWDDANMVGVTYAALFPERVGRMVLDGIPNFPLYMGISGNILDMSYNSDLHFPAILSEWSSQCVNAYNINTTSCAFAEKSMKASNPAADILTRIGNITSALATSARSFDNVPSDIFGYSEDMSGLLISPEAWRYTAYLFATFEQDFEDYIPSPQPKYNFTLVPGFNENLTLSSFDTFGDPPYAFNAWLGTGVICVDGSLDNISTSDAYARYIEGQISLDATDSYGALLAYPGVQFASCLAWPSSTLNGAELYRSAFPLSVKNKILLIAETLNPVWSYEGAFSTYQYMGSQNAVFFVHDAIGDGVFWDPNNCTYNTIREFLVTGMEVRNEADTGTLPANGTVCTTDHYGLNNVFMQNLGFATHEPGSNKSKLILGLVLGVAFPLIVGAIVAYGFYNLRRKSTSRRKAKSHLQRLKNEAVITESERTR